MQKTIFILFLLASSLVNAQNKIVYNEIVPDFILSYWENNKDLNSEKFQEEDLDQLKLLLQEFTKKENNVTSKQFLKKPSDNTLVAYYLKTKLQWNAFNLGQTKKLSNEQVISKTIKNLPERNELLGFYYKGIFIDVLNKQKPINLADVNINLEELNLENNTEKAIVFLSAMRSLGHQVNSFASARFPNNCYRAEQYVENMPKFNGLTFYEFELPEFEDFLIEVDKTKPKMSFKKRYLPEFENAKFSYNRCLLQKN